MVTKSLPLVAAVLLGLLLGPAFAVETEPEECGLASVYSSLSEDTASGEDTSSEYFTAAHRTLPFGTLIYVRIRKTGARSWCASPIAGRSFPDGSSTYPRSRRANSASPVWRRSV